MQAGQVMANFNQLIQQAKQILQNMDPATKREIANAVQQNRARGGDSATAIRQILQNMDPRTRQRLEQQTGVRLDARKASSIDAATIRDIMAKLTRGR